MATKIRKTASTFVALAKAYIGYNEKDGSHKKIIDIYNSREPRARGYKVSYNDAWCATFVSAISISLGYEDIVPPECSCYYMIEQFKKLGVFVENENRIPNVGDIVFYDWQDNGKGDNKGVPDHVGIVTSVTGSKFTVVEGNLSNSVKTRTLSKNSKNLRGFAVPKWDVEKSLDEIAREVILGRWGNGSTRKELLTKAGYNYTEVQNRVNEMLK